MDPSSAMRSSRSLIVISQGGPKLTKEDHFNQGRSTRYGRYGFGRTTFLLNKSINFVCFVHDITIQFPASMQCNNGTYEVGSARVPLEKGRRSCFKVF